LDIDWGEVVAGDVLIIECYTALDPDSSNKVYNDYGIEVKDLQNPNIDWDEEKCLILESIMDDAFGDYFKAFGDGLKPQFEYLDASEKIKSIFDEWDDCEG